MLAAGLVCSALAAGQLPLDIRARFGSIEITDTAYWDGNDSTWFVLIRTPDGTNMLLCYVLERGTWTQKFQTSAAVPQGEGRVRILFSDLARGSAGGQTAAQPILVIRQYGTGAEGADVNVHTEYLRSASGEWNLIRAFFAEEQVYLEISEDTVVFFSPAEKEPVGSCTAEIERDPRRIDLREVPRSPDYL